MLTFGDVVGLGAELGGAGVERLLLRGEGLMLLGERFVLAGEGLAAGRRDRCAGLRVSAGLR